MKKSLNLFHSLEEKKRIREGVSCVSSCPPPPFVWFEHEVEEEEKEERVASFNSSPLVYFCSLSQTSSVSSIKRVVVVVLDE